MIEYQPQRGSAGRHCLLTEDKCGLKICQSDCYGMYAAGVLKKLSQIGYLAHVERAIERAIGYLPEEKQEAIMQYLNEGRRLTPFEDFLSNQEE